MYTKVLMQMVGVNEHGYVHVDVTATVDVYVDVDVDAHVDGNGIWKMQRQTQLYM